jgi:hypothetical protein
MIMNHKQWMILFPSKLFGDQWVYCVHFAAVDVNTHFCTFSPIYNCTAAWNKLYKKEITSAILFIPAFRKEYLKKRKITQVMSVFTPTVLANRNTCSGWQLLCAWMSCMKELRDTSLKLGIRRLLLWQIWTWILEDFIQFGTHILCFGSVSLQFCILWNLYGTSSESSGIYCRVVNSMSTDVSEVRAASIRAMSEHSAKGSLLYRSLLLRTTHPSAIGPLPHLSSLSPHWSARSTWLLHNQLPIRPRLTHRPDNAGSMHLWNVGRHWIDYTAVYPRRLKFILAAVRTWNLT